MFVIFLLSFLMTCAPVSADTFWQKVNWTTSDGVQMGGLYHTPAQRGRLTWILLHGLGSEKEEWEPLALAIAKEGQGIFVYDARGHRSSQKKVDGSEIHYDHFDAGEWQKMPEDVVSAIDMLNKRFNKPINGYCLGGASVGANVALLASLKEPASLIRGVLLLSPGLEYAGLNIEKAYGQYAPRLLCMVASPGDRYAYQSVQILTAQRTDAQLRVMEGPGSAHGVKMLDSATTKKIMDWIRLVEARALLS